MPPTATPQTCWLPPLEMLLSTSRTWSGVDRDAVPGRTSPDGPVASAITSTTPIAVADTSPDWSTRAIDVSETDQLNCAPSTTAPDPLWATAAKRIVSPIATVSAPATRASATVVMKFFTVSVRMPATDSGTFTAGPKAFAVMTAVPGARNIACPCGSTRAIAVSELVQLNRIPATGFPVDVRALAV